jgi:hypothetical protein
MARLIAFVVVAVTFVGCRGGESPRTELLSAIESTLDAPSYRVRSSTSTDGSTPIDSTIERSGSRARLIRGDGLRDPMVSIGRVTYVGRSDRGRTYKRVRSPRGSTPPADDAAALLQTIVRSLRSAERKGDVLTYQLHPRKVDIEAPGTTRSAGSVTIRNGRIVTLTHRDRVSFSDDAGEGSSIRVRRFRFSYVRVPAITAPPADLVGH